MKRRLTFHMLGGTTMSTSVSAAQEDTVLTAWKKVQRSDSVQMDEAVITINGDPDFHIALGACVAITSAVNIADGLRR